MTSGIKELLITTTKYMVNLPELSHAYSPQGPLASFLDCALHEQDATPVMVGNLCDEAEVNHYASVFVNPIFVPLAKRKLEKSEVHVGTVVGFPLGGVTTEIKVDEAHRYVESGADEIDMVMAIGMLKAKDYQFVLEEIQQVVEVTHQAGCLVKVILETALLNKFEKILACLISKQAEADFVKTSTGFSKGGATVADVNLMRRVVGDVDSMGVKAAGGIHSLEDVMAMLNAGANRIGTRLAASILSEAKAPHQ